MADPQADAANVEAPRTARQRTSPIVQRNIRAVAELAAEQQRAKSMEDRFAMAVSRFAGSMNFVYVHALVFGLWAAASLGWIPGVHHFDKGMVALNTIATLEAIFLATFVLISQNRMAANEEIRNHLDVQVSLLAEDETTHVLRLVAAIGEKMGIEAANDPEIKQLIRSVEAQEIIDQIEVEIDEATSATLRGKTR
jgi:Predicted membrane protein